MLSSVPTLARANVLNSAGSVLNARLVVSIFVWQKMQLTLRVRMA